MAPSSLFLKAAMLAVVGLSSGVLAQPPYVVEDVYQGNPNGTGFFDMFTFFTDPDPNGGYVDYLDEADAFGYYALASINQYGQAFMGVDHRTYYNGTNAVGRPAVRVQSNKVYNGGLFIADIQHMPGSICGVWPAFWTVGLPNWPADGEIDIIENINENTVNLETLHTNAGCNITKSAQGGMANGDGVCDNNYQDPPNQYLNQGCSVTDDYAVNQPSYGTPFNDNQGGVYAMEWTDTTIKIWNFPRSQIPLDITNGTPDPSLWIPPTLTAGGDGLCDVSQHFVNHTMIFDIDFCGTFVDAFWSSTSCASEWATCEDYVAANPNDFQEVYWLVNYVKVFQRMQTSTTSVTSTTTSSTSTTSSTTTTTTTTTSSSSTTTTTTTTPTSTSTSSSSSTTTTTTTTTSSSSSTTSTESSTSATSTTTSSSSSSSTSQTTSSSTTSPTSTSSSTSSTTSTTSSISSSSSTSQTTPSSSTTSPTSTSSSTSFTSLTSTSSSSSSSSSSISITSITSSSTSSTMGPYTNSSTSSIQMTTSTVYTTATLTITKCPETVTNCPASSTIVVTSTIALYTTVCPVSAVTTPSSTASPISSSAPESTTSTVYTTAYITVTQCPATVTNCPAHSTLVYTSTYALYTTVCPVANAVSSPAISSSALTGAASGSSPAVTVVTLPVIPVSSVKYAAGNSTTPASRPASIATQSSPAGPTAKPSTYTTSGAQTVNTGSSMVALLMVAVAGMFML